MAEKKLDYQFDDEDVWGNDAILASNPLGKVPCLVMEGGEAVFDSRVIVEFLDARSPLARLIPEPNRERTEVRTWGSARRRHLPTPRSSPVSRRPGPAAGASSARRPGSTASWSKVRVALDAVATGLAESPGAAASTLTLADIAVGCALGYLAFRFPAGRLAH